MFESVESREAWFIKIKTFQFFLSKNMHCHPLHHDWETFFKILNAFWIVPLVSLLSQKPIKGKGRQLEKFFWKTWTLRISCNFNIIWEISSSKFSFSLFHSKVKSFCKQWLPKEVILLGFHLSTMLKTQRTLFLKIGSFMENGWTFCWIKWPQNN